MHRILFSICLALVFPLNIMAEQPQISDLLQKSSDQYSDGQKQVSLKTMQQAVVALWQEAGLWVDQSVLVSQPAEGFGLYQARPDNLYPPGEPILIYMKPMGFKHRKRTDGLYEFGVTADFLLKQANGEVLGGQENFKRIEMVSQEPNQELFLSLTYTLSGLPAGQYSLKTVLHDIVSKETASFENPIVITE